MSNSLDPDQSLHSVGPDLGPVYLQMTKLPLSKEKVNPLHAEPGYVIYVISNNLGILTSVDSEEPVHPPFKLRHFK